MLGRRSAEESSLQVSLDHCSSALAEAQDDACLLTLTSEGRLVDCCLFSGRILSQLAVCLMSMERLQCYSGLAVALGLQICFLMGDARFVLLAVAGSL